MDESILNSIKKLLGISDLDGSFDADIIMDINTVFGILWQIGVGPKVPFRITGPIETWKDFLDDISRIEFIKSYMHLRVAQLFDPAANGAIDESRNNLIKELEWRLYISSENETLKSD